MPTFAQRQHLSQKNALVDFDAVFLALHERAFGLDLLGVGVKPGTSLAAS